MNVIDTLRTPDGGEFPFVRCGEESIKALGKLERICFPEDFWSEISFFEALSVPACAIFAAYDEKLENIVAYGVIYTAADEGDLANIAVIPEMRRRGLGSALLCRMLAEAKERGADRMFLEVRESNENARALYEKVGFNNIGKRRNYYVNPREDAVIMEKSLI